MMDPNNIRKKILQMVCSSGEGHLASSFSIVEIIISIFKDMQAMRGKFLPNNFILSKGHASYAYYAILNSLQLLSNEELDNIGKNGSKLYGHLPFLKQDENFHFGSGSLGHGLPYAIGLAKSKNILKNQDWIYCLVGDGEANEGTFWESLLLMNKFDNIKLKLLIDCNSSSERAIPIKDTLKKIKYLFQNFEFSICNGHDQNDLQNCLSKGSNIKVILCETIKGYPVEMMKNNPVWHHKIPSQEEKKDILKELE